MGADASVDYEGTTDWPKPVLEKTSGHDADRIVDAGGTGTLGRSMHAVAETSTIALIGILSDADKHPSSCSLVQKRARLEGVFVGAIEQPKASFKGTNKAITMNEIGPIIDRVIPFDEAAETYRDLASGAQIEKVVLSL